MEKYDKALYGFIAGFILPLIGLPIGKYVICRGCSWKEYFGYFMEGGDYMNQIFTFTMLPTLFSFFFVFFQWKLDNASKGLVAVSLVLTAIFMALKFL